MRKNRFKIAKVLDLMLHITAQHSRTQQTT